MKFVEILDEHFRQIVQAVVGLKIASKDQENIHDGVDLVFFGQLSWKAFFLELFSYFFIEHKVDIDTVADQLGPDDFAY